MRLANLFFSFSTSNLLLLLFFSFFKEAINSLSAWGTTPNSSSFLLMGRTEKRLSPMTEEVEFQLHYGGLVMSSGSACPIGIGHPRNPMLGRGNLT
jgi:hypothetical protein